MPNILPKEKVKATRINPKIMVVYSMPKVGKTTALVDLPGCLILDLEGGAEMYDSLMFRVNNMNDFDAALAEIRADLMAQAQPLLDKGMQPSEARKLIKFPYKVIAIDTLDKLEEYCEVTATAKYVSTNQGRNFDGKSVLELPNGAGYLHLRNEVLEKIDDASKLCETLILVAHVKDKIVDKGGVNVTHADLSLAGKLSAMVCAKSDVIAYMFREAGKPLMINLAANQTTVMGARNFPHLTALMGQPFEFSWDKLLVSK